MNDKMKKLFAEIIASRPDRDDEYMTSPELLYAEIVKRVGKFNNTRAEAAKGITIGQILDEDVYFLPNGEYRRLFIPSKFLEPINLNEIDIGGFTRALLYDYEKSLSILYGDTGTGKTRTAYFGLAGYKSKSYALSACNLKRCVYSVSRSPDDSAGYFQTLCRIENLFIDDLSMCSFTQPFFEYFIEILNYRTCNDMETVFTLQLHPADWGDMLEKQGIEPFAVDALLRRLADFSYIVEFRANGKMENNSIPF